MALAFVGTVSAALLWPSASHAFEAIPFAEVNGLVGKQVYAANNKSLGLDKEVYAGDALTLLEAKPYGKGFNYVKVKTKEGVIGEIQIRFLSKSALRYSLRTPGTPAVLLKAILEDAYPLGAKMHAIGERHNHDVSADAVEDYHQLDATRASFDFSRHLLHGLVYGTNRDKVDLVKGDGTKWLGQADATLLAWYAGGIEDKKTKERFVNAVSSLNDLDSVSSHASSMAQARTEKTDKPWLRDLKDAPAATRAAIDKEKSQEADKEIADRKKKIDQAFASAAKAKALVK